MPAQMQVSEFLREFGPEIARANEECKDKPLELGFQRLPPGIKNGIAKVQSMQTLQQEKDDGSVPKGKSYFQATAVAVYPVSHDGHKVAGVALKSIFIPLCATPEKGFRKATTFKENYWKLQNFIRSLNGDKPCPETPAMDPNGVKTWVFWMTEMQKLTASQNPTYVKFATWSWKPDRKPGESEDEFKRREPALIEEWQGPADPEEVKKLLTFHPATAATLVSSNGEQPKPSDEPPTVGGDGLPLYQPGRGPEEEKQEERTEEMNESSPEETVAALVEVAERGHDKEDIQRAREELENLAWANGWTREETDAAADWEAVGQMALSEREEEVDESNEPEARKVEVGSRWKFQRRDKNSNKLLDDKKNEFPPTEVEVIWVDDTSLLCHVKDANSGRVVTDVRSKKPLTVKWEWLE